MAAADPGWTPREIPDLTGRTYVVTGANSGLGLATTTLLAQRGAEVVLACRSTARGEAAVASVRQAAPAARLHLRSLDLADLDSVAGFARASVEDFPRIDGLINNAGIMMPPYGRTVDGFETQIGVNHLGHVALTLQLLPALLTTPAARVITVSSVAHRSGEVVLNDLSFERRPYRRWSAYGQSKLANLLFTAELDRRLRATGTGALAAACHPGFSRTELGVGEIPGMRLGRPLQRLLLTQPAEMGAMPTLRAATDPGVRGNDYFGPAGRFESRGPAVRVGRSRLAADPVLAQALWHRSLDLIGVDDRVLSATSAEA